MDNIEITQRIYDLEREIASLPSGSISKKKINDKVYYYHRVSHGSKRTETYVNFEDIDALREQIERRKSLEKELKELRRLAPDSAKRSAAHKFKTYVRTGDQLARFATPVKGYKKRECFAKLHDYVYGSHQDKVFILYGLRRTGKTTLIRQILADMSESTLQKSAYIQIKAKDTLSDVNADLNYLEEHGYRYIFIDEVTLMEDFIEGAALFSDIFASSGLKIVLSGTDSLGFMLSADDQLYDRCIMLHTTFIPYREFENVLGIKGIDEYIRYGGTMSLGGVNYNESSVFANTKNAGEYIDSAIAKNVQHSLKCYQDGGHFRQLLDLYENDELTSAINRVVEDINHRFTVEVLTRTFKSNDLSLSARNLLRDRDQPFDLRGNIDEQTVTESLKQALEILDKDEQSVEIDEIHTYQIREYLMLLDLIEEIELVYFPNVNNRDKITVITQPGMRYAQADALVNSLLLDQAFNELSAVERSRVLERLRSEIKGRMMEDIVLLETKLAHPKKQVFKLQFAVGEFDMVIFDPNSLTCEIYEIKYSKDIVSQQYRHLADERKCAETEHHFGKIVGKYVIYRGDAAETEGINYLNVEEYLGHLADGDSI